jgi:pyruvate dehydrogenase E1 component beta subunit
VVVTPSTPYDAKGLLIQSIKSENPVAFIEHKKLYVEKGPVPEEMYGIPFGQAEVKRQGKDITIVATHALVLRSLNAAAEVAKEGIDVEVVDPRTLVPLDKTTILESVKKTGRLLVADEGTKTCGVAAEIAAMVAEEGLYYLKAPIVRVCSPDTPVPFSPPLEKAYIPDEKNLLPAIRRLMQYA